MSERHIHGQVTTEIVEQRVMVITVDRAEKRNGFTPKMLRELSEAMTELDEDDSLFVGVLCFAGDLTTAGLEMPLFFGPDADPAGLRTDGVDPLGLRRRLRKPQVTAVQGITYTIGIELALAGDIVVAADDARFAQLEPRRGVTALGGATLRFVSRGGWGNAMYHLLRADEFDATEARRIGLVQEMGEHLIVQSAKTRCSRSPRARKKPSAASARSTAGSLRARIWLRASHRSMNGGRLASPGARSNGRLLAQPCTSVRLVAVGSEIWIALIVIDPPSCGTA